MMDGLGCLHGDMGEDNTKHLVMKKEDAAEGQWIESGAHLMLMPKDPSTLAGQTTDFMSFIYHLILLTKF